MGTLTWGLRGKVEPSHSDTQEETMPSSSGYCWVMSGGGPWNCYSLLSTRLKGKPICRERQRQEMSEKWSSTLHACSLPDFCKSSLFLLLAAKRNLTSNLSSRYWKFSCSPLVPQSPSLETMQSTLCSVVPSTPPLILARYSSKLPLSTASIFSQILGGNLNDANFY